MKFKLLIIAFLWVTAASGQVSKYVIASCVISSLDGKKDTVFNGTDGNINCTLDMNAKKIDFKWDTREYKSVKSYTITRQDIKKDKMYETMGVYSMKLSCLNKDKKECSIDFGI